MTRRRHNRLCGAILVAAAPGQESLDSDRSFPDD
jgi:hypothetical protein